MKFRMHILGSSAGSMMALVILMAGIAVPAEAQRHDPVRAPNQGEALPLGPFLFSPSLLLSWQHRDNIFFRPDDQVADQMYLARAWLAFELPIYESYVRFSYSPQFRDYKEYELDEKWSHFLELSGNFEFASGLVVDADYRFVRGNLETREVDPGGELVFGGNPFDKNYFKLDLDYWLTARDGIRVFGDYTDVGYRDRVEAPPDARDRFYDYTRWSGGFGWLHQLNQVLVMDLSYRRSDFEPVDTLSSRTSTSDDVTLGLRGQLSAVVSSEVRVGWRRTEYSQTEMGPARDDFSGLIATGSVGWQMAHGSTLSLDVLRSDYPSNWGLNTHYTATGGGLTYRLNRGNLFGEALARYQNNDYEIPDQMTGEQRSDDITTVGFGLGWRFTGLLSLYGAYLYEDRSSITEYSYDTNIYTVGLTIGY